MESSFRRSKNKKRVFKTPLITPISVIMVILIYAGYTYFYATGKQMGVLTYFKSISFEVFLLCEAGMVSLIVYNKKKLDGFLHHCPVIRTMSEMETLKPIIRTNMYSSIIMFFFLGLGSLAAIMSILNDEWVKRVVVAILVLGAGQLMSWYNLSEQKIKDIECTNELLERDLNNMLQCWIHKLFPNF